MLTHEPRGNSLGAWRILLLLTPSPNFELMERLPSKATEDPVKLEGKKVESKEAKNDEKPIPEWEFSSDGDNNDEDEHTKMEDDI